MRKSLLIGVVFILSGAARLFAGAVYVPVASNQVVEGRVIETHVWVSNPTLQGREFLVQFIASGTDGTVADRALLTPRTLGPQQTVLLTDLVPLEASGMIEITADPALVVTSQLQPTVGEVPLPSARVPVVSSQNLIPAEGTAQLQALERTAAGTVSNVGILNLSIEPATCVARVFRSIGAAIGGTAILPLRPLSHIQFDRALELLGITEADGVRVEISCDQDFYAYATVFGVDPEETVFIQPSVSGDSTLQPPGLEPPAVKFAQGGNFLVATQRDPARTFQLPAGLNELFRRIEIEFDFRFGGFNSDLFHTIFSLRSDGLFCELTIRGDNQRSFWDTPGQSVRATGPWRARGRYHITTIYDVEEDVAIIEVSEDGKVLQVLEARANRPVLGNFDGSLRLDFSQRKVFDDAFFPLWGSTFSNLEVRLFPAQ